MNLHSNLQYPLVKYLLEELSGSFYENELTCLNRMLILFHNRYIFSIRDDTGDFLDEYEKHLKGRDLNHWYLVDSKRKQMDLTRIRALYLLRNNRPVFEQLLARRDYYSFEAKQQTIGKIYQWLQGLPFDIDPDTGLDIRQFRQDMQSGLSQFLDRPAKDAGHVKKSLKKPLYLHFHQILTGKDDAEKQRKFQRLADILIKERWVTATGNPGLYQFKNNNTGGRLRLAALYYTLDKQGHIQARLNAPQIARLFNSWLSHNISWNSFVKAFQTEQLDTFNCGASHHRHKHVQDCKLLIRDL